MQKIFALIIRFVLWVLLQALVFNNIHIGGYAIPMPYLYFVLTIPSTLDRGYLLLWAFGLGLGIDLFSNTTGIVAASLTLVAFVRPYVLGMFVSREKAEDGYDPGAAAMKWGPFFRYAAVLTLLHCALVLLIEAFSLANWEELLLKIGLSFGLTLLIICAFEGIRYGGSRSGQA